MKVIIVTGTPCTGKTTIAKNLARYLRVSELATSSLAHKSRLNFLYLDVNKIIKKYNLIEEYDKKRKCNVVDEKKLVKILIRKIKNLRSKRKFFGIIIDSHLSHFLSKKYVDLCIVTKCNLKVLQKRLKKRGYNKDKIRENLDCEIFDVCYNEAVEMGHEVIVVDTTNGVDIETIRRSIIS